MCETCVLIGILVNGYSSLGLRTMYIWTAVLYRSAGNTQRPLVTSLWTCRVRNALSIDQFSLHVLNYSTAIEELRNTGLFSSMSIETDEEEHSIEMHIPYVRKVFQGCVVIF